MTKMTKDMLKDVRVDVDAALEQIAKTYGIAKLRLGNCTYDPTAGSFTFKLEGVMEGGIGKEGARLQMEQSFDADLPKVGESFFFGTSNYTATGMNTTGSKVVVRREKDGKTFLIKRDAAKVAVRTARQAVA
jgi:hypothetical protein